MILLDETRITIIIRENYKRERVCQGKKKGGGGAKAFTVSGLKTRSLREHSSLQMRRACNKQLKN